MPNDAVSKPSPAPSPILDRFRSLLKDRDTGFTGADDGVVSIPPPSTAEIVRFHEDVLSELTFNSKPIITDLTIIAGEQRQHCEGIADLICSRVLENAQHARGASDLSQKHSIVYDDFESDMGEVVPSNVGAQRFSSTQFGGRTSFPLSADKLPPSVSGQDRPLSPSIDEFPVSKSPARTFEKTFTSLPDYSYQRRMRGKDEEIGDWQKGFRSDDLYHGFENVASYNFSNGRNHDRPRALIDAYGHDDGHRPLNEKPLGIDCRVVNGVASKTSQSWQNTEEEEFDWEDMSLTLVHSRTSDHTHSSTLHLDSIRAGPGIEPHGSKPSDPNLRSSSWTTSNQSGDRLPYKSSIPRNENSQITEHHHSLGAWKSSPVQDVSGTVRESSSQLPFPAQGVPPSFSVGKFSQGDNHAAVNDVALRLVSSGFSFVATTSTSVTSTSTGLLPSTSVNSMIPLSPLYPHQQYRNPVDFANPISVKPMQIQQPAFTPLLNLNRSPVTLPVSQDLRQSYVAIMSQFPPQIMRSPVSLSYTPLNHGVAASNITSNVTHNLNSSFPIQNVVNGFVQMHTPVHPLASGSCPPSQILPLPRRSISSVNQPPPVGVSGLINSLVAQGVLSLTKQTPAQESIGVEFDADLLKVRHESSVRAFYDDLPRQCTTCGLRFKTQEERSKHMDWHVTKNRISKSRKQNLSQKWFVSASMWLSGAEALGTDAVPRFLPTETAVEKKDDEEMAVPADENQTACALCDEAFEDFYSDETEEWMYRGAVYLNAPDGPVIGMDRLQLGPIVHAKCTSDSSAAYS